MNDTIMKLETLVERKEKELGIIQHGLDIVKEELGALEDKLDAAREAETEAQSGPWEWSCCQCIHDTTMFDRKPVCYQCGWHHGGPIDYNTPPDKYVNWLREETTP
jgi:hypothetical protein